MMSTELRKRVFIFNHAMCSVWHVSVVEGCSVVDKCSEQSKSLLWFILGDHVTCPFHCGEREVVGPGPCPCCHIPWIHNEWMDGDQTNVDEIVKEGLTRKNDVVS